MARLAFEIVRFHPVLSHRISRSPNSVRSSLLTSASSSHRRRSSSLISPSAILANTTPPPEIRRRKSPATLGTGLNRSLSRLRPFPARLQLLYPHPRVRNAVLLSLHCQSSFATRPSVTAPSILRHRTQTRQSLRLTARMASKGRCAALQQTQDTFHVHHAIRSRTLAVVTNILVRCPAQR